ncbi:MAG: amidohydrolase family protein [Gordonia sp. (in: high G+C Gram-positive bacteria)]|uniref:amidohydrolase n=1 Tax=Gordonia sp. (in: high G+C Gram-positive bacteria) TaxID=84139 RepID=UPI0039E3686C
MTTQLLLGGLVYSSPAVPDATAFAVTDGLVVWVGSDDVGRALHPDAEIVDLQGRFVSPAFVDSHVHLTDTGLALDGLDLSRAAGRTECLRELGAYLAAHPSTGSGSGTEGSGSGAEGSGSGAADEVVWGMGWDASAWVDAGPGEDRPPSTADLDAVAGDRPVYLARIDEHSAAASSALRARVPGLSEAPGYDDQAPLFAEAHHLVRAHARALLTPDQRRRAQLRALDHAAAHGVVAVHENGGPEISGLDDFRSLADLDHPVRVRRYWGQCVSSADEARAVVAETGADAIGGDLFVDGALGSHTALLSESYTDRPDTRGVAYLDYDRIRDHLRATTEAGIQAGFHVIGDAAAALVAEAVAELADELGTPALARCAHRLEHAEMVTPEQAELFARCGFVASMQPLFDAAWGGPDRLYAQRLGDRAATLNDFAGLSKAGVALAFSSDAPVCPIDPWATVRAAAHHHRPTSAISPRAAFAAATRGGWRAGGVNDGLTGTLVPGAPAHYAVWDVEDLVVAPSHAGVQRWSTDPRSRVPALPDVTPGVHLPQCVLTAVAGDVIYSRDPR